ncbi:MAG TPA: hypothetical protein VNW06_11065 [Cytophagaceae bacterium]|jgi:hypothetical protein|nr:hypothetical protein [Cytophagaceae bacterium]
MKTIGNMIMGCILTASLALNSFGQAPMKSVDKGGKKPNKIEKTSVPKTVTDVYVLEYPMSTNEVWYSYPAFSEDSDWYGYDPYLEGGVSPEYYIVEFTSKEKIPHKVIYTKEGKKVATHRKLNAELPAAVSTAINTGEYKGWTVQKDKQEMFKMKDTDKVKVYRVIVEKGMDKHALYYESDGTLLKDKRLI